MPNPISRTCPDCHAATEEIRLVDATSSTPGDRPVSHLDLTYVAMDSERSAWTKAYKPTGSVRGLLCSGCGRITLYAVPA